MSDDYSEWRDSANSRSIQEAIRRADWQCKQIKQGKTITRTEQEKYTIVVAEELFVETRPNRPVLNETYSQ